MLSVELQRRADMTLRAKTVHLSPPRRSTAAAPVQDAAEHLGPPAKARKPPPSPASPGALPRLRHQHRILIGAAAAPPGPLTPGPGEIP